MYLKHLQGNQVKQRRFFTDSRIFCEKRSKLGNQAFAKFGQVGQ